MKRHLQLFAHKPEENQYGDCHRTAIACLLDLDPSDVPHFYELKVEAERRGETYRWRDECEKFLNSMGIAQFDIQFNCDLETLLDYMRHQNPDVLYLLGGQSDRGINHTVICRGGVFEWDPHPNSTFLSAPLDNGFYEVTVLLPISMKAIQEFVEPNHAR